MRFSRTAGLFLSIVLLSISITSCGSSKEAPTAEPTDTPVVEQAEPAAETQAESAEAPASESAESEATAAETVELPVLAPEGEDASQETSYRSQVSTSWVLDYIGEDDAQVEPIADSRVTLGFMPKRYGGDGGCNFYTGVYSQDGENVVLESPATTGSMCQDNPDLLRQETTFMSLLATSSTYNIVDGKLKLYSSEGQQLLTLSPVNPAQMEGTEWKLRFINSETQWEEIIPDSVVTLSLDGNTISGNSGCNEYGGEATITEDGYIQLFASTMTNQFCEEPAGVMDQEQLYIEKLSQTGLMRYFTTSFELLDKDGMPLLIYSADWQDYMDQ